MKRSFLVFYSIIVLTAAVVYGASLLEGRVLFYFLAALIGIITAAIFIFRKQKSAEFDFLSPPVITTLHACVIFAITGVLNLDNFDSMTRYRGADIFWQNKALFCILSGLLCLWMGFYFAKAFQRAKESQMDFAWSEGKIIFPWVLVLYVIGMAVRVFYFIRLGQWGYLSIDDATFAAESNILAGTLRHIEYFCQYALVLAAIKAYARPAEQMFTPEAIFYRKFCLIILIAEILFGFLSGMKQSILQPVLYVGIALYYSGKKIRWSWILGGILLMAVSYPVINGYRDFLINNPNYSQRKTEAIPVLFDLFNDVTNKKQAKNSLSASQEAWLNRLGMTPEFAGAIEYTDTVGRYPGWDKFLFMPAAAFVPRFLWASKPVNNFPTWLYRILYDTTHDVSVTATTPGFFYLHFSFLGFYLAMFVWGYLQGWIYHLYRFSRNIRGLFMGAFIILPISMADSADFNAVIVGLVQRLMIMYFISLVVIRKSSVNKKIQMLQT